MQTGSAAAPAALVANIAREVFAYDDPGGDGGGGSEDLDCADFRTRGQAQAELAEDPGDPNNLDADDDGQACEDFDYGDHREGGEGGGGAADHQYGKDKVIVETIPKKKLADTGGSPLALPTGALLLSTILRSHLVGNAPTT